MSDKRPIYVVPVNPEAYGLGILIGCLLQFWPVILGGLVLLGVIVGVIAGAQALFKQVQTTYSASQIEVRSLNVRYDPNFRKGAFEGAFAVEYEIFNNSTQMRQIDVGVQLPVSFKGCRNLADNEYSFVYGSWGYLDGQRFTREVIDLPPKQTTRGVIDMDSEAPAFGVIGDYSINHYTKNCASYNVGAPVFKIMEAK